jgi:hypothetical protein
MLCLLRNSMWTFPLGRIVVIKAYCWEKKGRLICISFNTPACKFSIIPHCQWGAGEGERKEEGRQI